MATNLEVGINYVNADHNYDEYPSDFIILDFDNDYLIWSETLDDLMTHEPTADELNNAAAIIEESVDVTVAKCLLMDYSHNVGGSYYTHLVKGMGENKRYVFCFSFDGSTNTEPQLEAWDDDGHDSIDAKVLGTGVPNNSMVKAICTTLNPPGVWAGSPIAGANILLLNGGNGALTTPGSGLKNNLYANIKIVIPAAFEIPGAETFILTVRYTWS